MLISIRVALLFLLVVPAAARLQSQTVLPHRELVDKHCLACHNDRARTAGLSLSATEFQNVGGDRELWEKVLHKIRTGQMPPQNRPRPEPALANAAASWIESALDRAEAANPDPGRVVAHRLNRTEYANVIRDLLGLEIDAKSLLLPDEADEGFDNIAESLAVSPAHLERYLSAARTISRLAVGDPALGAVPVSQLYRVPKLLEQDVRLNDDLPFGSRGGVAVRHHFLLDGEYVFKVRLRRQVYDYIIGMGQPHDLDIRVDGRLVKRFTVGGEGKGTPGPLTWNGEVVGDTEWELYMHAADAGLEVSAPMKAGVHLVTASFAGSRWEPEGAPQPLQADFGRGADEQYDGFPAVDALTIRGPYRPGGSGDTISRRIIFVCRPKNAGDEEPCARKILSSLARRAFRRPATPEDLQDLLSFYREERKEAGFEAGIQAALERILASFSFLYRVEGKAPKAVAGRAYPLNDVDLASRLSFFLWNSIPDEELLRVAERGRLKEAAILEQQVRRMLRDPRSKALVESFASQWLTIRKALTWQPDTNRFPEFDENLRDAFLQETQLFIDSQLREDRSVLDLVSVDYSFINERLAQHYGIPGVHGDRFRKFTFTDGVRGGLLGQGGILMVTSYPDRTAPVVRGLWALENLLGMPPPPPPPDVPDLESRSADGRLLSIRQQMEVHRENPACAVCHVRMDPLGFALENFDAIGKWRSVSEGVPVDASAVFADGTPIEGVNGLRKFLVSHRENYVRTFTAKLLAYALGRKVDYRDNPAIRKIQREAAAAGYRWSSIILGIARSSSFTMTKASEETGNPKRSASAR